MVVVVRDNVALRCRMIMSNSLVVIPAGLPAATRWRHTVFLSPGPGALRLGLAPVVATFSTYKSPKFYLSFTILVSFILVKYSDRIGPGPVNTVPTVPTVSTSPTGKKS